MNDTAKSVLIIGAGMAGLIAADMLTKQGYQVTILDKARGVGGRMATRRLMGGRFDHGAQYFTARDEHFTRLVSNWQAAGVVREWSRGFCTPDGELKTNQEPRYRGGNGMTHIAKHLSADKNIHLQTRVSAVTPHPKGGWQVATESGNSYQADALLITAPVPQTLALLREVDLPTEFRYALERITYDPCFAVMAALDRPTQIPAPGGLWGDGDPLDWVADNHQKGISPDQYGITLHASAAYTRRHWEDDPAQVAEELLAAARPWLGQAQILETSVQRWRYSKPSLGHPDRHLLLSDPAPLAIAGDAFGEPRVEGAALSGLSAAQALLKLGEGQ